MHFHKSHSCVVSPELRKQCHQLPRSPPQGQLVVFSLPSHAACVGCWTWANPTLDECTRRLSGNLGRTQKGGDIAPKISSALNH